MPGYNVRNRVSQRDMLPGSIRQRSLGQIIGITAEDSASATISNGERVVVDNTFESTIKADFALAEPYITVYLTSVSDANQIPGGSAVTDAEWLVYHHFDFQDWSRERHLSFIQTIVTNVSAGSSKAVVYQSIGKYVSGSQKGGVS